MGLMIGVRILKEVLIKRMVSCIFCFFALIILIGKYTIFGNEEQYDIDMEKIFYDEEIIENMGNPFSEEAEKEVFSLFEGEWKVVDYIASAPTEHVGMYQNKQEYEEAQEHSKKIEKELSEKYLNTILIISEENVISFSRPLEIGFYYKDWNEFLLVYNKLFIATGEYIELPCICAIMKLEDHDESLYIAMGSNGKVVLGVKGSVFLLEKEK